MLSVSRSKLFTDNLFTELCFWPTNCQTYTFKKSNKESTFLILVYVGNTDPQADFTNWSVDQTSLQPMSTNTRL